MKVLLYTIGWTCLRHYVIITVYGRVVVEADDTDSDLEVSVLMTDIPAFHDMATGNSAV